MRRVAMTLLMYGANTFISSNNSLQSSLITRGLIPNCSNAFACVLCNRFNGEIIIATAVWSISKGMTIERVFPEPVPALMIVLLPRYAASPASSWNFRGITEQFDTEETRRQARSMSRRKSRSSAEWIQFRSFSSSTEDDVSQKRKPALSNSREKMRVRVSSRVHSGESWRVRKS